MTVSPYAVACKSILYPAIRSRKTWLTVDSDVVTILVSWSADHFNARAMHSAVCAAIGACAFMASALLPATSYQVRTLLSVSRLPLPNLSTSNVTAV